MKPITKCPECGGVLQATLKVHLTNLAVENGQIVKYDLHLTPDWSLAEMIESGGPEDIDLYCENDHSLSLHDDVFGEPE